MAVAHTLVTCALWYPGVVYCCRSAPVSPREVVGVMVVPAAAAIGAGLGLMAVSSVLPPGISVPVRFLLDLVIYAALDIGAWAAVPVGRQSIDLAREVLAKKPVRER